MLPHLVLRVGLMGLVALAVAIAYRNDVSLAVTSTPHTLVGLALGLLLVFRTNASYDRFWEGRKLWGGIVNASRNLGRSAAALFGDDPVYTDLIRWVRAYPYACMHSLRGSTPVFPEGVLSDIVREPNVPLAISVRMSLALKSAMAKGLISDVQQMALDREVGTLIELIGGCERIHKTPLPFAYVVHLRRAVVLYCLTLPFCLVQPMGWWSILATVFIAYVMLGIEEIGVEIEDPFGTDANDLPLERICETIAKNLDELRRA
jgi:putative membrane protein